MKKIGILIGVALLLFTNVKAEELKLAPNAKSAMIIEASTGTILYEKNIHERFAPASMTKIMSLLLIMESIDKGDLRLDEEVRVSASASGMGGSQIYLEENEIMTVDNMLKGIAIASANDATVALAERVGGTETHFVEMMNRKVNELGLKNTHFMNSHGLDEENHYSSAFDMIAIARELIKHEKILEYSSIYETYLRPNTDKKVWLVNTNKLVRFYDGVDGLKTGYTEQAGYCLTATAKRSNMRLLAVVFGEPESTTRNKEVSDMLDYGFNSYDVENFLSTEQSVGTIEVLKGKERSVKIAPLENVDILFKKGVDRKSVTYKLDIRKTDAPLKKGDVIGEIKIYEDGNYERSINLTVTNDIPKISIFGYFGRNLIDIIGGNFM